MRRPVHRQRDRRAGFTLVEILVALGLTLLLVTVVYMALDLHYEMSTAGRGVATKAQLERAIIERIESDLRSVVFQLPNASTPEGEAADEDPVSSSSSSSSSSAAGEESAGSAATEFRIQSSSSSAETESSGSGFIGGIMGDADTIMIYVSRPSREGYATSDLRSVSYFIADRHGEGLAKAMADRIPEQRIDDPDHDSKYDHLVGLSRLDGDQLQLQFADEEQSSDEALALQTELLAPEVVSLQFRYFDGLEWYEEWDSTAAGAIPAAVEVTLGFVYEPLPGVRRPGASTVRTRTIGYRRYVVRLPLAIPTVSDSVL
jgi:prepilin-type N-terminal cleavage/methylation domain-containing protein